MVTSLKNALLLFSLSLAVVAQAESPSIGVTVNSVSAAGIGDKIGTITIKETEKGLELIPNLKGLPPGQRGFHVHESPDCGPKEKEGKLSAAEAAGPHYDPDKSGKHLGPHGDGHRGDLPALAVGEDGSATTAVIAERLTLQDVIGRSLMIHGGGDNYSDTPQLLGGGGPRIACGVIKKERESL